MKLSYVGALVLLGAIWGASFLFIREAAHDFGPSVLMFLRVFFAGLVLVPIAIFAFHSPNKLSGQQMLSHWREFLVMGAFSSGIPFVLIAFSELTITASLASILNSMTPLFTALIASIWIGEKLTSSKILGLVLGIIGVTILVGGSPLTLDTEFLIAVGASLLAAFCYGIGAVYTSQHIKGIPSLQASIGQLFGAALILALPATASVPETPPTMRAIIALVALILVSTSFAYLLYFYLISNVGPTRAVSVTFLVPIFGTVWGIIFLNEPFNLGMLVGMSIILLSVGLVLGARFRKSKVVAAT